MIHATAPDVWTELRPLDQFDAEWSMVLACAGLLLVTALAAFALRLAFVYRRKAAAAAASFRPDAPYVAGEVVLHGRVQTAEGAPLAVRVEVEQEGTEKQSSGAWTHKWTEVDRRVIVAPFYLVSASGRRTRVEPTEDVFLVDEMDGKILIDITRRVRTAELTPDKEVWAFGTLVSAVDPEGAGGGYRSGATLVLKSPAREPMLLSSEPLGARFEARAKFHRRWGLVITLLAVLSSSLTFGPLFMRRFAGETVSARITSLEPYLSTNSDGDEIKMYRVRYAMSRPDRAFRNNVHFRIFTKLEKGQTIPIRFVRSMPRFTSLGPDATADGFWVFSFFGLWIGMAIAYRVRTRSSLPWYEKKVIDEGAGTLSES
jgi:hypothetical protein